MSPEGKLSSIVMTAIVATACTASTERTNAYSSRQILPIQPIVERVPADVQSDCMRVDISEDVDRVKNTMGIWVFRAWQPYEQIGWGYAEEILKNVEKKGGVSIYVLTPTQLPEREGLRYSVDYILRTYPHAIIEIGNEPDNTVVPFWKERNLDTFAQFVKAAMEDVQAVDPERPVIIGAVMDVKNMRSMLAALHAHGVDMHKPYYAVHAYNSVGMVRDVLRISANELGKYGISPEKIVVTELGALQPLQGELPAMRKAALDAGAGLVCVHTVNDADLEFGLTLEAMLRYKNAIQPEAGR